VQPWVVHAEDAVNEEHGVGVPVQSVPPSGYWQPAATHSVGRLSQLLHKYGVPVQVAALSTHPGQAQL
jgi:hypothetical protein